MRKNLMTMVVTCFELLVIFLLFLWCGGVDDVDLQKEVDLCWILV